ncbi:MAG: ATP-dependent helicase [Anaerolineae bacterium]|nr:ATP-dependent helicase [Anaerolineae bacterium]
MVFKPRPAQERVIQFRSGRMGVLAVPGSGKTQTLSYLAARLIIESCIGDDQEVLIVTLVNSAVNNFASRIESYLRDMHLMPGIGYRVRTLHGLAHDIVRERPDLAGLSDRFQILDEHEAQNILETAATTWLQTHPEFINRYALSNNDSRENRASKMDWQQLVVQIAGAFIRKAKDLQILPHQIYQQIDRFNTPLPLIEMGHEIYLNYQRALNYRGAVDFDDLIRLALQALRNDESYLDRLRQRWPYILEDEAQDSSRLQEDILRLLTDAGGNWVRVGDTNQAIYETFTTASPEYLRRFVEEQGVQKCDLPNSGRSTASIIFLANRLIEWTNHEHPYSELRNALLPPLIQPAPQGDPQPNPPDRPDQIYLEMKKYQPDDELKTVAQSIRKWIKLHPEETVAALVPRNERGIKLVEELRKYDVPYIELLNSSHATRRVAHILVSILNSLADPSSSAKLAQAFLAVSRYPKENPTPEGQDEVGNTLIRKCPRLEDYLWSTPGNEWLNQLEAEGHPQVTLTMLAEFQQLVTRWQLATLLPIDQLILSIAQDIFTQPSDLALAHKIALLLEQFASAHPDWRLPQLIQELMLVSQNQRKFLGFSEEDTGFDPDQHPGKVVVATIHKSKGLEWDRVYLLSVNNYDFPSTDPQDIFIAEKWFVRSQLNLSEETLAQLSALAEGDTAGVLIEEGVATHEARLNYARERLRLLYVGITRARKELVITWNSGKQGKSLAALPLVALKKSWEEEYLATTV